MDAHGFKEDVVAVAVPSGPSLAEQDRGVRYSQPLQAYLQSGSHANNKCAGRIMRFLLGMPKFR